LGKIQLNTLKIITLLTELLPFLFCVSNLKNLNTKPLKVFFIYTTLQLLTSLSIAFSIYFLNSYSLYFMILDVHLVLEFYIIAIFYILAYKKTLFKWILGSMAIFFLLYLVFSSSFNSNQIFNSTTTLIQFLFLILFSLFYLFDYLDNLELIPLTRNPYFFISISLLFYFAGNFFYILLVNNSKDAEQQVQLYLIVSYSIVSIIKNILLSISIIKLKNNSKVKNAFTDSLPNLDFQIDSISPNQR
jgi:hypothetical protein